LPEVVGSALLLQIGDRKFAISARHVFKRLHTNSIGIVGSGLAELHGQHFYYTTERAQEGDLFDLAFVALTERQVEDLGECLYLGLSDLDLMERPDFGHALSSKYFAHGFPCSVQNWIGPGDPVRPRPFTIHSLPAPVEKYAPLGCDSERHLLIEFDRKNALDLAGPRTAPKPNGMSGCGIWTAPRGTASESSALVAILTEHHAGSHKVIVSTRVRAVLGGVWKHFEELRPTLVEALALAV
jgi:hypothetical protein